MTVENRIVSINFDNAAFQSKLSQTIVSLDNLKKSLDFANSKKSLADLSNAGKNFDMGRMADTVDKIGSRFSALGMAGVTALATITSRAVSSGAQFLKSFTMGPIIAGFQEFETNMNSIQTILANTSSKGTTLKEVNAALLELNKYSDQTIYNFTEMARNIGTFTAAGIDLKPATQAIKGIANLAAVSGSSADQASTAMYQLSQAMAAGSVKLQDWNSVVNAGMGGEVFQKSLWETGKALGTLKNIPIGETFDEWKKKGNTFRETLKDGWITTDVVTKTLAGFTGDLTQKQVEAMGYTKEQAAEIVRMGKVAKDAATQVKTFTQLVGTVKEAIGSGWTQSFQILFGDFAESKQLFTSINNAIGKFVSASANARNTMLQDWKDLGGRTMLIQGFKDALAGIGSILKPIREALREFFPKKTGEDLFVMTQNFKDFAASLKIGADTADKIKRIFRGVFAVFGIGKEIVIGIFNVFRDLFTALAPARSGLLDFGASGGDMLVKLNKALVAGGGIRDFFNGLTKFIIAPIKFIQELSKRIVSFFKMDVGDNRVTSRLDQIGDTANRIGSLWDRMGKRFQGVIKVLDKVWTYIANWFKELGSRIADAFKPGDFDSAVDIVNVGLLGGITILLKRFFKNGIKVDFGGGLIDKIKDTFDGLTNTLKAMQTNLKADALMKIAAAVGILVAAITVLSLINSKALTKALLALSVSFGQLIGTMTVLDKMNIKTGIVKLNGIATALILIATAAVVLSAAVKIMSSMDLGALAKGLTGVGVGLGLLVAATRTITADTGGLISAGLAMIAISTALLILSAAVRSFSKMSWGDMAKGLVGVAAGLTALTVAMNFMPAASVLSGAGFIEIALGLSLLAGAVKLFSKFSWADMGKGLVGIAGGLVVVAASMHLMPLSLPITAAGVLILSVALDVMAHAVSRMGRNDIAGLAKGIGAFAAMLLVLVVAMNAMNGAVVGATALIFVAGAMLILTKVITTLGELDVHQVVQGLLALAGVLAVLGIAAVALQGVSPALFELGLALTFVGAGFALFGTGAILVAKAFEILAKSGAAGAKAIVEAVKVLYTAVPTITAAFALTVIGFAKELLKAMPLLVRLMTAVLEQLLVTIIREAPKIGKAFEVVITTFLKLVRAKSPDIVATGFQMLLDFLKGVRDNIKEITLVVADIIVGFFDALTAKTPEIVDSVYNFIRTVILEVSKKIPGLIGTFVEAGKNIIMGLLQGMIDKAEDLFKWFISLPGRLLNIIKSALGISSPSRSFLQIGVDIITGLINGLAKKAVELSAWFISLPIKILGWVGNIAKTLVIKGVQLLDGFFNGVLDGVIGVKNWFLDLPGKVLGWIGNVSKRLVTKGFELLWGFLTGIGQAVPTIMAWFKSLPGQIWDWLKGIGDCLISIGWDIIMGLWNGMKKGWDIVKGWLESLKDLIPFHKGPPAEDAKLLVSAGKLIMGGLRTGMESEWKGISKWLETLDPAASLEGMSKTVSKIADSLSENMDFNPVITPVLDLTKIQAGASQMNKYMTAPTITPDKSLVQASLISSATEANKAASAAPTETGPTEINFTQINNSPAALSTNDIYRNTKSQIALAKEELSIS